MRHLASPPAALLLLSLLAPFALTRAGRAQERAVPLRELTQAPSLPDGRTRPLRLARRVAQLVGGPLRGLSTPTVGRFRLGVIPVEFPDQPRPGGQAGDLRALERLFFAQGRESVADFYRENSGGRFEITGRVFDWVQIPTPRAELDQKVFLLPGASKPLTGASIDAVLARPGGDQLWDMDALVFVIAGEWGPRRGSLTWPHASIASHRGRIWNHYVMVAGRGDPPLLGVHCHELGHVLGILDLYGVGPDVGLGQWCLMASGSWGGRVDDVPFDAPLRPLEDAARDLFEDQTDKARAWLEDLFQGNSPPPPRRGTLPLHFSAVCKTRLGWSKPRVIQPQLAARRFYLEPIETDPDQVARVLLDPDGRESVFLEYRTRRGYDRTLPRGGLLVWRSGSPLASLRTFVPFERIELFPAHGIQGKDSTDAARRDPRRVPWPLPDATRLVVAGERRGSWAIELSRIEEVGRGDDRRIEVSLRRLPRGRD